MKFRDLRFGTFVLAFSVATLPARLVRAEDAPDNAEKARTLFKEGRALASDGKYDEACPKFEESLKLDAGMGTQFNLADCLEHTGRIKKAQEMFLRVADAAHEKAQADREQVARDRAHALDEKLPKIGIEVKEVVEGLEVLIDGKAVDRTKWATGERVDPGNHEIAAKAPHKKNWSLSVEVGAASTKLTITVPKLEDETSKPKAAVEPAEAKAEAKEPPPKTPAQTKPKTVDQTMKILFLGGAGAGVVLAATGFGLYKMSNDNAKDVCPASVNCTQDEIQRHEDYLDDAAIGRTVGYLGAGLAGAALIGFTVVALSSSSRETVQGATVRAAPLLGGGAYGASLGGRF